MIEHNKSYKPRRGTWLVERDYKGNPSALLKETRRLLEEAQAHEILNLSRKDRFDDKDYILTRAELLPEGKEKEEIMREIGQINWSAPPKWQEERTNPQVVEDTANRFESRQEQDDLGWSLEFEERAERIQYSVFKKEKTKPEVIDDLLRLISEVEAKIKSNLKGKDAGELICDKSRLMRELLSSLYSVIKT